MALDHRKTIPTCGAELNCPTPDMFNKKRHRSLLQPAVAAHSKPLLFPMPRKEASDLVLRARIALERLRKGEADRSLINLVLQITRVASFITRAGHGKLDIAVLDAVRHGLEDIVMEAGNTGTWDVSEALIDGLIAVINEYDRQICTTRMEIVVRASDHLDRLANLATRDTRGADTHSQLAQ